MVANLDQTPDYPYAALSYYWGEPVFDRTITCDDFKMAVSQNLDMALRRARHFGWHVMWADAVCINQKDFAARASQVAMMGRIYSKALFVAVYLGEQHPYTSAAVEYAHLFYGFALSKTRDFTVVSKDIFVNNTRIEIPQTVQSPQAKRLFKRLPYVDGDSSSVAQNEFFGMLS